MLKLNGKTDIPRPRIRYPSACHGRRCRPARRRRGRVHAVHRNARAGARLAQYREVRDDAQRLGMPLIVWSYPRGAAIDAKGGKDCFYAVDYAARTASELGADVVKVELPRPAKQSDVPELYRAAFSDPAGDRLRGPVGEPDPAAGLRR